MGNHTWECQTSDSRRYLENMQISFVCLFQETTERRGSLEASYTKMCRPLTWLSH